MAKVKIDLDAEETQIQIFQLHELMDRIQIVSTMSDALCASHPVCKEEWAAQIVKAQEILGKIYQKAADQQNALIDHANKLILAGQ
jgi:hypothetical protein